MVLATLSVLVLTKDEAANIGRTLAAVSWAPEVVVVDSGSTDRTAEIVGSVPRARLCHRPFTDFGEQWTFAMAQARSEAEWLLLLDADHVAPPELRHELERLQPLVEVSAYAAEFDYAIEGRKIRCGLYGPNIVLLRRGRAEVFQDGHAHRVRVLTGRVERLASRFLHDDRKPVARWLSTQAKYAALEARKLAEHPDSSLRRRDLLRKRTLLGPLAVAAYVFLVRGGWRDGRAGLVYALQRALYESILVTARHLHRLQSERVDP